MDATWKRNDDADDAAAAAAAADDDDDDDGDGDGAWMSGCLCQDVDVEK